MLVILRGGIKNLHITVRFAFVFLYFNSKGECTHCMFFPSFFAMTYGTHTQDRSLYHRSLYLHRYVSHTQTAQGVELYTSEDT